MGADLYIASAERRYAPQLRCALVREKECVSVCVAVVTSSGLWREGARRGHGAWAGPPATEDPRAGRRATCVCDTRRGPHVAAHRGRRTRWNGRVFYDRDRPLVPLLRTQTAHVRSYHVRRPTRKTARVSAPIRISRPPRPRRASDWTCRPCCRASYWCRATSPSSS